MGSHKEVGNMSLKTGERKSLSYVLAERSKTKMCLINRVILVKRFPSKVLKVLLLFLLHITKM